MLLYIDYDRDFKLFLGNVRAYGYRGHIWDIRLWSLATTILDGFWPQSLTYQKLWPMAITNCLPSCMSQVINDNYMVTWCMGPLL